MRICFNILALLIFLSTEVSCQIDKNFHDDILPGAFSTQEYVPKLKNKKVGVVGNQSSMINNTHLVDSLISLGINVVRVFSPEHGFRGKADAGEKVSHGKDKQTGLPIISLYGKNRKPAPEQIKDLDILLFDIQDVGVRFYTYIYTMHYVMEAAAENNKKVIVLDRPNPNGFYVDGPVLKEGFTSFIGMHPVPIVYGMTIGEYAKMTVGEKWLANGIQCDLEVIKCKNYTHNSYYKLPIKPSPNLPNMNSVYLYPSICFFEGSVFSEGRGTDYPFQVYGHPQHLDKSFSFTPRSIEGASKNTKLKGIECYGKDLSNDVGYEIRKTRTLNLSWFLNAYKDFPMREEFFKKNNFINLLAGTDQFQKQIINNLTEKEIKESWKPELESFKKTRQKYLIYKDFDHPH